MSDEVQDPFTPGEAQVIMRELYGYYVAALEAGFPEERAFGLVRDFFVGQMGMVLAAAINAMQQRG